MNGFIRTSAIAKELGITQRRAQQLVKLGIIPGRKVERIWLVKLDAFVAYRIEVLDDLNLNPTGLKQFIERVLSGSS